jgi:hypothetical protein
LSIQYLGVAVSTNFCDGRTGWKQYVSPKKDVDIIISIIYLN